MKGDMARGREPFTNSTRSTRDNNEPTGLLILDLYEVVNIVEVQNISAETLDTINCSEFHDASSKPPF
jgi:hypothetical protein